MTFHTHGTQTPAHTHTHTHTHTCTHAHAHAHTHTRTHARRAGIIIKVVWKKLFFQVAFKYARLWMLDEASGIPQAGKVHATYEQECLTLINMNANNVKAEHISTFLTYVLRAMCSYTPSLGSVGEDGRTSADVVCSWFITTGAHADRAARL